MTSTTVYDAAVVTTEGEPGVIDRGWLHTVGNEIVEVGTGAVPRARLRADVVIDGSGMALMPGMVNGHTHLFQTFFRGLGDDKSLLDWLRDYIWPTASVMTAEEAGLAAAVGLIENLRTGATTVLDHQYIHGDPGIDHEVFAAAERLGVRYLMARGWADRNYEPRLTEDVDTVLRRGAEVHDRWHGAGNGRLRIEQAPLIPWGCSDQATRATAAQSASWGSGLHVHCAETAAEVEMSLSERALRHVPWLDSLGALGPDTQLAHSVWLDDDELDLIAARGSTVVHCPVSNMYLASGVPRIPDMLRRGIPIALASDGPGSNNRQDMFEAMKVAVLLQKVHHLDPVIMQPEDAIAMATVGGARAVGMADRIGVLAPGRLADWVLVDLDSPFIAPVHRVLSALVFNATPRDVHSVAVDGQLVLRERTLLVADERALLAQARAACGELFGRAGIRRRGA